MNVKCVIDMCILGEGTCEQRQHVQNKTPHQPIEQIGVEQNRQEWQQIFVYLPYV